LRQSPPGTMHFDMNVSIVNLVGKVVLLNNPGSDLHVFIPVKGGRTVKGFDVKAHELGIGCAEHAIPMKFCCCDVRHLCREFTMVIDEISPGCDSDAIGVLFLWAVVDHHSGVCDDSPWECEVCWKRT
jgi:hypothetical protein